MGGGGRGGEGEGERGRGEREERSIYKTTKVVVPLTAYSKELLLVVITS